MNRSTGVVVIGGTTYFFNGFNVSAFSGSISPTLTSSQTSSINSVLAQIFALSLEDGSTVTSTAGQSAEAAAMMVLMQSSSELSLQFAQTLQSMRNMDTELFETLSPSSGAGCQ